MTLGPFTTFPQVDTIVLANITLPGKWTLLEAPKKFGWQIQQGYGLSGAFVFPKGDELIVAKFKGQFWDSADYATYREIRKRLFQKGVISLAGVPVTAALGVNHPELIAMGVESVVCLEVNPCIDSGGGLWETKLDLLQYRRPLPAPKKPQQTIPSIAPPIPKPKTSQEIEIQALRATIAGRS